MVSIIVPVYNVVQYLRHCLQSLAEQGLDDYEVILVNDASRDNSRGICSEWCAEHPEFRLINHDVNMGLSEARNTGIREARGEWITFVDSDDFLERNTLLDVMQNATDDVDVLEYPVMEHYLGSSPQLLSFSLCNISFKTWLDNGGHKHCYAWNKVYRKALWSDSYFPIGKHYEDIFTIPYILKKARNIRQVNVGCYYYCERQGSICTTMAEGTLLDYLEAYNKLLLLPESENNYDMYLRAINGEITYRKISGRNKTKIIKRQSIPFRYVFSKGLSFHDRLKILWIACTHHG